MIYERNLPCYKPFSLLEVGKRLCSVTNSYILVLVSLFINSFCVDERNQPSDTEFILTCNQCVTEGLIPFIYEKRVYEQRHEYKGLLFSAFGYSVSSIRIRSGCEI